MKKTGLFVLFLVTLATGITFAQACNWYESGTEKMMARITNVVNQGNAGDHAITICYKFLLTNPEYLVIIPVELMS
jgi:hypothetical protein